MSMCSDHKTLWRSPVTESAYLTSLAYYSSFVSAPPIVFYTWCIVFVIAVASIGWRVVRGFRAEGRGQGEFLFDGASLCESLWMGWLGGCSVAQGRGRGLGGEWLEEEEALREGKGETSSS
jgi:hypothetical protein